MAMSRTPEMDVARAQDEVKTSTKTANEVVTMSTASGQTLDSESMHIYVLFV